MATRTRNSVQSAVAVGARSATLRDVAKLASVSVKTASRVLNDSPNVSQGTRRAVLEAMSQLSYQPDPAARSLRAGRDQTIGLIVDSVSDIFFAQLAAAVEEVLRAHGYATLIASSNREVSRERQLASSFVQRRCAGMIVAPVRNDSLASLPLQGTPLVFVDRAGATPGTQSVVIDDILMGKEATRHLIAHGHERIALLSDVPKMQTTADRLLGFRSAMKEAGLLLDERLVRTDVPDAREAFGAIHQLLALDRPPTALIVTNSRLALGVVPALHQEGATHLALVSCGDFAMAEALSPAVTVFQHSPSAIGARAAEALIAQIDGEEFEQPLITLSVPLVPRGSGELAPSSSRSRRIMSKQSTASDGRVTNG